MLQEVVMGDIRHYGLQDVVVGDTTLFWVTREVVVGDTKSLWVTGSRGLQEVVVGDMSHCG